MLRRFQNENVTSQDIDFLNNEWIVENDMDIPLGIKYATYTNVEPSCGLTSFKVSTACYIVSVHVHISQ
jgi:hypothetical protein